MANWLGIAGGAAQGVLEGQLDNQQRAQFDFLQKQRQRTLQQQAIEDAAEAKARGVLPAGEYDLEDRSGVGANDVGPVQATKRVKRTEDDVAADRIKALSEGNAAQRAQALQMSTAGLQNKSLQLALQKQEELRNITRQFSDASTAIYQGNWNHPAVQQYMSAYNAQHGPFNDGRTARVVDSANGPVLGFFDQKGTQVGITPLTPQHVAPMLLDAYKAQLAFHDPEYLYKNEDAATKGITAQAHATTADAAQRTAATNAAKVAYETTGPYAKAHLESIQAEAALRQAQTAAAAQAATAAKFGPPVQFMDDNGNVVQGVWQMPTRGGAAPTFTTMQLPPGLHPMKLPQTMDDFQTLATKALFQRDQNGDWKPGERDEFVSRNRLGPFQGKTMADMYIDLKGKQGEGKANGAATARGIPAPLPADAQRAREIAADPTRGRNAAPAEVLADKRLREQQMANDKTIKELRQRMKSPKNGQDFTDAKQTLDAYIAKTYPYQ